MHLDLQVADWQLHSISRSSINSDVTAHGLKRFIFIQKAVMTKKVFLLHQNLVFGTFYCRQRDQHSPYAKWHVVLRGFAHINHEVLLMFCFSI